MSELSLSQQYMLLALDPAAHKFGLPARHVMQTFACGAAIAELLLDGRLRLREDGKLEVAGATSPGRSAGPELLLAQLADGGSPATIRKWMHELYSRSRLRLPFFKTELEPLLAGGMMREERRKLLFVFPATRYIPHPAATARIVQHLRDELLAEETPDARAALLAMLLDASKLLKSYFAADELQRLRGKLKQLQERQHEKIGVFRQMRRTIDEIHVVIVTTSSM